jgi:hypothetical protein
MFAALINFLEMIRIANAAADLSSRGRYDAARELMKKYYY